jgi:hypothetical protein
MRKIFLAALAILLLVPAASFGIQYDMMNDSGMDEVTAQSGVSIAFDDIQLFINIERLAWIDCDGFDSGVNGVANCTGDAGAVGLQNFQLDVLEVNMITNTTGVGTAGTDNPNLGSVLCGNLDLNWDYGSTTPLGGCQIATSYEGGTLTGGTLGLDNYDTAAAVGSAAGFKFSALTIDATSELPALTEQYQGNGGPGTIGGVLIGIPTMEVYIPAMTLTPAFYNVEGAVAADNDVDGEAGTAFDGGADFGTIEMTGITFTTLSGWIEIAPH